MTCFAPKCNVKKEGERQITCWLCDDLYHMKCVGLLARTTDQLIDSSLGLRWCCLKCRKIDIEFYKFFTGTRNEFSDMHKEFASLYAKFRKFEERFDKFDRLNKLVEGNMSPSSPKRRKVVEKAPVEPFGIVPPVVNRNINPTVEITAPHDSPSCSTVSPNLIELDPKSPIDPRGLRGADTVNNVDVNIAQSKKSAVRPVSPPRQLKVVRPRKTIFVSRLARDTIDLDLIHYVNSKLDGIRDMHCVKMNPNSERGISSFRLIVPHEAFDRIVDPEFWPLGILVREFVYRERPGINPVNLPTSIRNQTVSNSQKN